MGHELSDLVSGLAKPSCLPRSWAGLRAALDWRFEGADAVGRAATRTIVWSIVTLILADLLFTIGFYAIRVG